ncbi:hypothetical protein G9A89_019169 [Geosiphon pyriformis]|nr:hypothetical protein G9A89_019169 [Geosiphon pyriformis]
MKFFTSSLILLATTLASISAHTTMKNPLPRGHPLNPNAAVKDYNCLTTPLNGGPGCAPKPFPCGGYPVDKTITQVFKAGDVINVEFWNPNFPNGPTDADATANQARHNGGLCEFALSYDGGNSYTKIATYHESCPDIFFDWKVKIPENAPSCDDPGKCIFSWSWLNALGNREFYQNCADIKIDGTATEPLPIIDITRANVSPFANNMVPPGDNPNNGNAKGSGPRSSDTEANMHNKIGSGSSKAPSKSTSIDGKGKSGSGNPITGDSSSSNPVTGDSSSSNPVTGDSSSSNPVTGDSSSSKPVIGDSSPFKIGNGTDQTPLSSGDQKPAKGHIKHGRKSGKKGTVRKSTIPTSPLAGAAVSGTINNSDASQAKSGACSNGAMSCEEEDKSPAFNICENGKFVLAQCPGGTVCKVKRDSIQCGHSVRKF